MKHHNNIYLFIGPPGSGKGSLSALCVKSLGWKQLSTGDLCRRHIKDQTKIGKQIDFAIKSGKLVSDSIIVEMGNEWLAEQLALGKNVILDGYPRTVPQAEALDSFLQATFKDVTFSVIKLVISDDVVIERILGRYICQNKDCQAVYSLASGSTQKPKKDLTCDMCGSEIIRRSDDAEEAIKERLRIYHEHEHKLLDFYTYLGKEIKSIDVNKSLDKVFEDFKQLVDLDV